MKDDIVEAKAQFIQNNDGAAADPVFVFDPQAFQAAHPNPKTDEYRLTDDELRDWGIRVTKIRAKIKEIAAVHDDVVGANDGQIVLE